MKDFSDTDWSLQENCRALLCIENGKKKHCGDMVMGKKRYCARHSQNTGATK